MSRLFIVVALLTGCATTLPDTKRQDMRAKLAHNTRCMDYEECDRPVKR